MSHPTHPKGTASARPEHCIMDDCDGPANIPGTARGYCKKHYARWKNHGDPHITLICIENAPACAERECGRPHLAKGLCAYHYAQMREALQPACLATGCERPSRSRGLCNTHYQRARKFGTPREDRPIASALPEGAQWCNQCSRVKPLSEFPTASNRKRGVASFCRACFSELSRSRYRPVIYTQQRAWRRANPDRASGYGRRYRRANPDKIRAKHERLKARYPERYREYAKTGDRNRRARVRAASGRATTAQRDSRWDYFGGLCWMCGAPADVLDHVKPLAKTGSGWPANLRPACNPCNWRKRATWPYPLGVVRGGQRAARAIAEANPVDC